MSTALAAFLVRMQLLFTPPVTDLANLPKVGGMASIPTRAENLPAVLAEVMPQVDRLHLFLHGYDAVPEATNHPRIITYLAPKSHPYRASGKFYGLSQETAPCLFIGFDDDILYHAGHVERLIRAIKRYRGRAVVGVHGARYLSPDATFRTHRRSYFFERGFINDRVVDVLGTGTVAFVSSMLPIDPPSWPYGNMDDIMLAMEAERRHMPRILVARRKKSISAIATAQDDSLWRAAVNDDTLHTQQIRLLLEIIGKRPKG